MAYKVPAESAKPPAPKPVSTHFHHASVKGAANLLRKHGHLDEVTHGAIVKHAERGMKKAKANI